MEGKSSHDAVQNQSSNGDNSLPHHLDSQVGELQPSQVSGFDQSRVSAALHETSETTQIACEEDAIMEDGANSGDEESWASLTDLRTETTIASPYFPDLSEYANGGLPLFADGNGILAAPDPTVISSNENTQDLSLNHESLPTGGFTSVGVLNNLDDMDEVATMSKKYGVFPFIKKTADMSFHNHQLSHLLDQHLTRPLPQLTDPISMVQVADITMTLAPRKNITLVLDIDGTLIHSSMIDDGADFSFPMLREDKVCTVYVKKRPYVDAFLTKVAEMFEIAVFTASLSSYADQLLDILDPGNKLISRRYYRESCLLVGNGYLKNLTVIEADLAKVAIIDNTPEVFQLHVNNGIPINTWSSDPNDVSLLELIPFLETLAAAEDVRPIIASKFAN